MKTAIPNLKQIKFVTLKVSAFHCPSKKNVCSAGGFSPSAILDDAGNVEGYTA